MEITPLWPVLGAQISGVNVGELSDEHFETIRRALVDYEVLVFPEQDITQAQHMAFGRRFGPLTVSPFSPNADDAPELIVLDNHPDSPRPLTDIWHSDETYRAEPPLTTILRAKIVPELGGDTMFASMSAAYEALSHRMKIYLSGMTALHGFGRFGEMLRADPSRRHLLHDVESRMEMPHHPVVRVHPESNRKVLFVNPHFTLSLDGVDAQESRALLDFLFTRALMPEIQLRVSWQPNTVVMWDNRSVQHYAPNDYLPQRRRMERVTIKGDTPVGDAPLHNFETHVRGVDARRWGDSFGTDLDGAAPKREFDRK